MVYRICSALVLIAMVFASCSTFAPSIDPVSDTEPLEPVVQAAEALPDESISRRRAPDQTAVVPVLPDPDLLFVDSLFQRPPSPSVTATEIPLPQIASRMDLQFDALAQQHEASQGAGDASPGPTVAAAASVAPSVPLDALSAGADVRIGSVADRTPTQAVAAAPVARVAPDHDGAASSAASPAPGVLASGRSATSPVALPPPLSTSANGVNASSTGSAGLPAAAALEGSASAPTGNPTGPQLSDSAGVAAPTGTWRPDVAPYEPPISSAQETAAPAEQIIRFGAVAPDSEISVVLPGRGWLYVGRELDGANVSLLGKERRGDDEAFLFSVPGGGDQTLWFQQQDALTGSIADRRLELDILQGAPVELVYSELSTSRLPSGTVSASRIPGNDASTGSVTAVTTPEELSLTDVLASSDPGGILSDDATVRRMQTELSAYPIEVVRSFWREVSSAGGRSAPDAREWLLRDALSLRDSSATLSALRTLIDNDELPVVSAGDLSVQERELLLGLATGTDDPGVAMRLVLRDRGMKDELLNRFPSMTDAALFALANESFTAGPGQDLRLAAKAYEYIVDLHPLSGFWNDSRDRLQYIERHYFHVR